MKIDHIEDHSPLRKTEYPDIGDQLDVLWKALSNLQTNGVDIGSEATSMLNSINSTKTKFPKGVS